MLRNPQNSSEPDKEEMLALLQAHGQGFLSSFGAIPQLTAQQKRKRRKLDHHGSNGTEGEISDKGWTGFGSEESVRSESGVSGSDCSEEMDNEELDNINVQDDDFRSDELLQEQPEVVVFSTSSQIKCSRMSKSQAKSFMSSKVSKVREEVVDVGASGLADDNDDDHEEERTNQQNDALLHKLVHTQLLSGSLNSELNLTPAQRRKALEGRVLELAAGAKLGRGEAVVRQEERKKASKKVRMGLEQKVEERKRKALKEAKELGNYHHSMKHLYEADADKKAGRRKRDRGLKLGVGKFSGGVLKLSKDEIASVQSDARHTKGGSRGGRKDSHRR